MEIQTQVCPEELYRLLTQASEDELTAQIIMYNGCLHALEHLLKIGVTHDNAYLMRESIENCLLKVEQVAAEKGYSIEFERKRLNAS